MAAAVLLLSLQRRSRRASWGSPFTAPPLPPLSQASAVAGQQAFWQRPGFWAANAFGLAWTLAFLGAGLVRPEREKGACR